jgi:hypothetical protein
MVGPTNLKPRLFIAIEIVCDSGGVADAHQHLAPLGVNRITTPCGRR